MKCPRCGEPCERDMVDVGVGEIPAGPWGCFTCHWTEGDVLCLHPWLKQPVCEYCRFYVALGVLVDLSNPTWHRLEAVAELLTLHARTRRQHNREMREEQRDAGRTANEAYAEGRHAAREDLDWR